MAERYRHELQKEIPEIDALLGTDEVPRIVGAISGRAAADAARSRSFERPAPSTPHPAQHPAPGTQHPAPAQPTYTTPKPRAA